MSWSSPQGSASSAAALQITPLLRAGLLRRGHERQPGDGGLGRGRVRTTQALANADVGRKDGRPGGVRHVLRMAHL